MNCSCEMSSYASIGAALFAAAAAVGSAAWVVCTRSPAEAGQPRTPRPTTTYYQAPDGKKLHAARECQALTNVTVVTMHKFDAEATKVLYRVGSLCVRCAGPHAI